MSAIAQRAAPPPPAHSLAGTVHLVLACAAELQRVVAEGWTRDVTAEIPSLVRIGISVP